MIELTEREQLIIELIAKGKTNGQIASQIRVSKHTVDNLLTKLYKRLGIHDGSKRVKITLLTKGKK